VAYKNWRFHGGLRPKESFELKLGDLNQLPQAERYYYGSYLEYFLKSISLSYQ
jgi:hypothetical protein